MWQTYDELGEAVLKLRDESERRTIRAVIVVMAVPANTKVLFSCRLSEWHRLETHEKRCTDRRAPTTKSARGGLHRIHDEGALEFDEALER